MIKDIDRFKKEISLSPEKEIFLLDTTLRDGSYAIDFQFTANDTALILEDLHNSGLKYIEVGHGCGLSAYKKGYGKSYETDEGYLEACFSQSEANWGMFCIPGIGELNDIKLASKYNMKFIRIGINPNDIEKSYRFIELSKELGMTVCVNFMKSYTLDPNLFANNVRRVYKAGADIAYIVDSSGSMLPSELEIYIKT